MNVAKRQQMKDREDAQLQKKCEKRLTRGPMWKELEHSSEFPGPGKKLAMRGPFKRYMDAQRHGVTCDAGMPKWWEIAPLDPSHGTAEGVSLEHVWNDSEDVACVGGCLYQVQEKVSAR